MSEIIWTELLISIRIGFHWYIGLNWLTSIDPICWIIHQSGMISKIDQRARNDDAETSDINVTQPTRESPK